MPDYTGGYTGATDAASVMRSRTVMDNLRMQEVAKMAMEQANAARMLQARQQAGGVLYGLMGGGGAPQAIPPVPGAAMPSAAPAPGSMSPGGGNPAVMPPSGAQPMPMQGFAPAPQPIAPFRALPSQPVQGAAPMGGGEVPPPPTAAAPTQDPGMPGGMPSRPFDLKNIIQGLRRQGIPPESVMDMLDTLAPAMTAENRQELDFYKANNQALKAANDAYIKALNAATAGRRVDVQQQDVDRKQAQGDRRLDQGEEKLRIARARLSKVAGGAENLKSVELVYPKDADGKPDTSKEPIGTRGVTKSGKIVMLDSNGQQVTSLGGATQKEGKGGGGQAAVRSSIVKGGVVNALNRLDEIERTFGDNTTTSSFFGQHGDNPATRALYGAARGAQSKQQQDADAKWASFIDEAIPVFTGGLRGSDAFRRFLIEQAPAPGDKPETVREKRRLFRENIKGTSKAFFSKFQADPTMWGAGVTAEQAKGASAPQQDAPRGTIPAGVPAGSTVVGKTPDGRDVYRAPDGKNYTAD